MAGVSYGNPEIGIENVGNNRFDSKNGKFASHQRVRYVTAETIRRHVTDDNIRIQEHITRLYIQRRALC